MKDCMIDLETLGTTPQTPVISIGAVFFDIKGNKLGPKIYLTLNVSEQIDRGRKPTADTIKWWMTQSDAAKRVFKETAEPTKVALEAFSLWFKSNGTGASAWGNGSSFDISILEDMFRDYDVECPWAFNRVMDLRTFKRFNGSGGVVNPGVAHNALDDAIAQAQYVLDCISDDQ